MEDLDLARRLKRLHRTVLMLETELRHGHFDEELLNEVDAQLEDGIATEPRSLALRDQVDALRENTLTPGGNMFTDTIRACEKLKDAIQHILDSLG